MDEKRLDVASFGAAVAAVVGYLAHRVVAALTVSVFLYDSKRRDYRSLRRLRLPARVRAVVVLGTLAGPLVLVVSLIAIAAYRGYTDVAPPVVAVPSPTLAGSLTGIACLLPVVGVKIVYLPLAGTATLRSLLGQDASGLVHVGGLPRRRGRGRRLDPPSSSGRSCPGRPPTRGC